jgi:carboxylate-amine ligase
MSAGHAGSYTQRVALPQAFGASEPWSLGIEEELFVLEAETLAPAPFPAESFDRVRFKPELFASVVELNTGICRSAAQAGEELVELREEAKRRAARAGLVLAAAGTWPPAEPEAQEISGDEHYRRFVQYAGSSAHRQYVSGLHVHVGMASAGACMAALEAVLPWLPVILAVSANSPYLAGRETGLASARAEILALLPRSGAPPVFRAYRDWEVFAERLLRLGLADEYTRIWWDVRPHPRFGTLEVRMPDQPTRLEISVAFAALVQALVASAHDGATADRGLYEENRWAALRFGPAAALVHPDGSHLQPVPEQLGELLTRVLPTAERLGSADLLAPLEGLDQAREQLGLGGRQGLRSLCERLVALT